jgi:hypothetical protein
VTTVRVSVGRLIVECEPEDEVTAQVIAEACNEALRLARASWGLGPPADCHLYVMTSWRGFIFHSAPWPWKLMLAITYPAWGVRARRSWPYSAGWTQRYGRRIAIGIKPPRLLDVSDKTIGAHMYVEEKDAGAKIRHLTCHELIHAASAHLLLPAWLNEGLAAVSVDRFTGKATIREDTLALVQRFLPKRPPPTYRQLSRLHGEAIADHAVRGYWIVRLLEQANPGWLRGLLSMHRSPKEIERRVAEALRIPPERFWDEIDSVLAGQFTPGGPSAS